MDNGIDEIRIQIKKYYDAYFAVNAAYESWAKARGLTANALFVLYVIQEFSEQCTQKLICEKMLLPKQTVSAILETFEKKGYVRKETAASDKRNKYILFTESGRKYADEILTSLLHFEEKAFMGMVPEERAALVRGNLAFQEQLIHALK